MATTNAAKLQLSLGFGGNPRSFPILDGTVPIEGVELTTEDVPVGDLFYRQLKFQEFDISEMSNSPSTMRAKISCGGETARYSSAMSCGLTAP